VQIGGMPSLKEITRMILVNRQYHPKEIESRFQNDWDRLTIRFSFT
jgi:hypothetical protein